MRKFALFLVSIFALLLFVQVDVFACRCVIASNQTLEQKINADIKNAKAVFSGKVIEITDLSYVSSILVKIKVEESWKEILPEEITLATDRSSCGYRFEMGKSYLLFAHNSDDYDLSTAKCLSNKELEKAAEELKILGKGKKDRLQCPTIVLISQTEGLPKNTWIYTARVKSVNPNLKLTYDWKYEIGNKISEIKSGQNTPQITIDKVDLFVGIVVGVKIGGFPTGCPNSVGQGAIE